MKRFLAMLLACILTIGALAVPAMADETSDESGNNDSGDIIDIGDIDLTDVTNGEYATIAEGDWRVVMGANLTDEQRAQVFGVFGITDFEYSDRFLTVSND